MLTQIEQEKLPSEDGWKKSDRIIKQADLSHLIMNLIAANEHKTTEAADVGLGTVTAVTNAVQAHLPSYCTIM
jgi:hypothetical protein